MKNFNFGFSKLWVLKVCKGTRIEFERIRVDEIWLPKRMLLDGKVNLLGLTQHYRQEDIYSQYQKFTSDTNIIY